MVARKTAAKKAPVRRKKPAPKTVEVVMTVRLQEADIRNRLAETLVDELYNQFRGYGKKPAVKISVAGKEVT